MSARNYQQRERQDRTAGLSQGRRGVDPDPKAGPLADLEAQANQSAGVRRTAQLREMLNGPVQREAAGASENRTGLSDGLKAGLEQLSGMDLSSVRVHYNSSKPSQLQALAYTQGQDIHVAPGQERHLPHEGWHVVQQMEGRVRPTTQLRGTAINDSPMLEKEADVMGGKAALSTRALVQAKEVPGPRAQGVVVQRAGAGLAEQGINVRYVENLRRNLKALLPDKRLELIRSSINDALEEAGVPKVTVEDRDVKGFGEFKSDTWSMAIPHSMLASDDDRILGELAGLVYHEARHAEQYFRVAQKYASEDNERGLNLPGEIRRNAIDAKGQLAESSEELRQKTAQWAESLKNPRAILDPMDEAERDLSVQVDNYKRSIGEVIAAASDLPALLDQGGSYLEPLLSKVAAYRTKARTLAFCQRVMETWMKEYRNMPHERDAHELGWLVEDMFRTGDGRMIAYDRSYENRFPSGDRIWETLARIESGINALEVLAEEVGRSPDEEGLEDFEIPPEIKAATVAGSTGKGPEDPEYKNLYERALKRFREEPQEPKAVKSTQEELRDKVVALNATLVLWNTVEADYLNAVSATLHRRSVI